MVNFYPKSEVFTLSLPGGSLYPLDKETQNKIRLPEQYRLQYVQVLPAQDRRNL